MEVPLNVGAVPCEIQIKQTIFEFSTIYHNTMTIILILLVAIPCFTGRFFKCIRCPTAYHVGEFCMAAGSMQLEGHNIVCSRHFQPVRTQSHHQHINVSWCFLCSKGTFF